MILDIAATKIYEKIDMLFCTNELNTCNSGKYFLKNIVYMK